MEDLSHDGDVDSEGVVAAQAHDRVQRLVGRRLHLWHLRARRKVTSPSSEGEKEGDRDRERARESAGRERAREREIIFTSDTRTAVALVQLKLLPRTE